MLLKTRFFAVLGCALAVGFITGCGKTEEEINKIAQSKDSAVTKIKAALDKSSKGIGGTLSNSKATSKATKALSAAVPGTDTAASGDAPTSDSDVGKIFDELSTELEASVTALLGEGELRGNDVYYKANGADICTDDSTTPPTPDAECEEFIEDHVTVVQKPVSDDAGTLSFLFDSSEILKVGYSNIEVSYLFNLTNLNGVFDTIREYDADTPDLTMAGSLSASFALTGTDTATVTLAVPSAISFSGPEDSGVAFDIAATNKLIQIKGSESAQTASVEFNVGQITGTFPYKSNTAELDLAALTGKIDIAGDVMTITNLGVGTTGLTMKIGGQSALAFTADSLDATINGATGLITLLNHTASDSTINANLSLTNVAGVFDSLFDSSTHIATPTDTISMSAAVAHDTQIQQYTDAFGNDITKVVTGSVSITVNDPVGGDSGTVSMVAGRCYDDESNQTSCPTSGTQGS